MRRSQRLSPAQRWDLALFLAMLVVACGCIAASLKHERLPQLFATAQAAPVIAPPAPPPVPPAPAVPVVATPTLPPAPVHSFEEAPTVVATDDAAPEIKTYKGKRYRYVKTLRLRVTAYAPDPRCCWPYDGKTTASGLSVKTNRGRLVAADTRLIPMHALVSVPGYHAGEAVPVLDRGGAIKGHRLDVLLPNYDQAKTWGAKLLDVRVYQPVE